MYVRPLLNPTYQFGKGKFTLQVSALNVRTEKTPGNLNTNKHMLVKGLSQVVRQTGRCGLTGIFFPLACPRHNICRHCIMRLVER